MKETIRCKDGGMVLRYIEVNTDMQKKYVVAVLCSLLESCWDKASACHTTYPIENIDSVNVPSEIFQSPKLFNQPQLPQHGGA